ncbi:MAG: AAC(3) family N-acetyltransferase [Planctomycetes bacterium]|nr:AAC(3) family N-acetyltransferase [Planctomycetota bacterium]
MALTRDDLVRGLRGLGLRNGDLVLAHSSLSSLGEVEGGVETLAEALIEACGPDGTVAVPTHGGKRPWHVHESRSYLGALPEAFRQRPDAVRSIHPTHSVAARGPRAVEFTRDHEKAPTACGRGTPYARLIDWDGKILLIGCDQDRNTTLHTIEDYADLPYLSPLEATYYDEKGEVRTLRMTRFPGPHRDFIGLDRLLRRAGVMCTGKIGKAVCRLISARGMQDVVLEALRRDPAAVLCDNPSCEDCLWQRGKTKQARLQREESFILSASTDILGRTIPEIVLACRAQGILHVEASTLEEKDVLDLPPQKTQELSQALARHGIRVRAVRSNARPHDLPALVDAAGRFNASVIILPMSADCAGQIGRLQDSETTVLLENVGQAPEECLSLMQAVPFPNVGMSFNPANFARQRLHPFLGVYYKPRNRFRIRQLVLSDATWAGAPALLGQGNAEVKELISILRCRSFDGILSLRGPLPPGSAFRDLAAAFWRLLDTL